MGIELVTGFAGEAHVTAAQDGRRNAGTFGSGRFVLNTGQKLALTMQSANQATVGTGDGIMDGRHVTVESPVTLTIESGAQGVKRQDLVCVRYTLDAQTGIESVELVVVKGTATSGTPSDPSYNAGSIMDGAPTVDWPLWRIPIDGITVGTPVLIPAILPTIAALKASVDTAASGITGLQTRATILENKCKSGVITKSYVNVPLEENQVWLVTLMRGSECFACLIWKSAGKNYRVVLTGTEVTTSNKRWTAFATETSAVFGIYSEDRASVYAANRLT